MQFVLMLSMKYDVKHLFSLLSWLWKEQYVNITKTESLSVLHKMLAVIVMMIKKWNTRMLS